MQQVEAHVGEHISNYIERAIELANRKQSEIQCNFNNASWTVLPGESTAAVELKYEKSNEEYYNSDEYKEIARKCAEREEQRKKALKVKLEQAMIDFNNIDVTNGTQLMSWFKTYGYDFDNIHAKEFYDKDIVVQTLYDAGYKRNACLGDEYQETKECNLKYVIGQALDGFERMGAPHQMIVMFAERWLEKFSE